MNWFVDEGVNLSGTLFVPENATHGKRPPRASWSRRRQIAASPFYASYCIELSRRGYVVLFHDYYGTMSSDFSNDDASGANSGP